MDTRERCTVPRTFAQKVLMITGGTGSFGHAVLKYFLHTDVGEIRIFSRDEKKQEDMRVAFNNPKLNFIIGDVRDFESISTAMKSVDFVFHAGALKQVPSCEFYPMQAIRTNVLGAENVLEAALSHEVQRVVVLSTDKAVYPINTMGMTKALMEKLTIAKARDARASERHAVFAATRYGNVMGSRGSIIPLFVRQIKEGKPLTVTDRRMTRFMMSLDDSVDLVLYAFEHAQPGDVFVQKAPAATIIDVALALKDIFNAANDINFIGPRHGEKMYETLCSKEEMSKAVDLGNFYRIPADMRDLNYSRYVQTDGPKLGEYDYNSNTTHRLGIDELKQLFLSLDYIRHELGLVPAC